MNPHVWIYVGIFFAALAAVLLILLLWRRRELRREKAIKAAAFFSEAKLEDLAGLCTAYAVGNYVGRDSVGEHLVHLVKRIEGEGLPKIFRELGWLMVDHFTRNAGDLAEVERRVSAARTIAAAPVAK
jgi:hypothetical protein